MGVGLKNDTPGVPPGPLGPCTGRIDSRGVVSLPALGSVPTDDSSSFVCSHPTCATWLNGELQVVQVPLQFIIREVIEPAEISAWIDFCNPVDQLLLGEHDVLLFSE